MLEIKYNGEVAKAWVVDYNWEDGCRFGSDIALVFADNEKDACEKLQKALWAYDSYVDITNINSCKEADGNTVVCNKLVDDIRKGK